MKSTVILVGLVCVTSWAVAADKTPMFAYHVKNMGAKGDGKTFDTKAVQAAIDACSEKGGGTVYFAPGMYLCGSIRLKSGVTLWLDTAATIKGSPDNNDYDPAEKLGFKNAADVETSFFHFALIWGEDAEHIGIKGGGTVDSNRIKRHGPKAIALKRCKYVDIQDIRIVNIPNYPISLLGTDYVNIDNVTIQNAHADGIDPDSCRNVRISNCHIESPDDAIVPKASFSLGERRPCENITVTNCYLATESYAFKLGTESGGDFKRIAVSNCVMSGLTPDEPAAGGVALESVDGSNIDGIVVSNCTMINVQSPIFIRLGNRGRDMETKVPGSLQNVVISGIVATDASFTSSITGIPGHYPQGVTLSDVRIVYKSNGPFISPDAEIPESIPEYPCIGMFGPVPGYGLYCRHVDGLTLNNVQLLFADNFQRSVLTEKDKKDDADNLPLAPGPGRAGSALVCDDVRNLHIDHLEAKVGAERDPVIRFANVRDALIRGCSAPPDTNVFLEAVGTETSGISLLGNVFTAAEKPVALGDGAKKEAVVLEGNVK